MNWNSLSLQLAQILQTDIKKNSVAVAEWDAESWINERNGEIRFRTFEAEDRVHYLSVRQDRVTDTEMKLIELAIKAYLQTTQASSQHIPNVEKLALQLKEWINQQIAEGRPFTEMPSFLMAEQVLNTLQIPIMIYRDSDHPPVMYNDLIKLLRSFFQSKVLLIPLKEREWLVLVADEVLKASEENDEPSAEESDLEESLEHLCYGLHDMLANEWIGECHLSIAQPIIPAKEVVEAVVSLRESIQLGQKFYLEQSLHFPWQMKLERLLYRLSTEDKRKFVAEIFGRTDAQVDQETMVTLETFFELNCNVSETAKKLYIHRNTLLYRLEKFRQETGLDPRNFNQAVLVKLANLLYKVTKRK